MQLEDAKQFSNGAKVYIRDRTGKWRAYTYEGFLGHSSSTGQWTALVDDGMNIWEKPISSISLFVQTKYEI